MDFSHIKSLRIEVTDYCNLSCPTCARHVETHEHQVKTLSLQPSVNKNYVSYEDFVQWFPYEFLCDRVENVLICGNAGEPTLCPDLHKIISYLVFCGCYISISTNGSTNNPEWWRKLSRLGRDKLTVVWHPDSIKENNNLYRIGSKTEKVLDNIKSFNDAGGKSTYKLIVFSHNSDEIDTHKTIAKDLNCQDFIASYPNGFEVHSEYLIKGKNKEYTISSSIDNPITYNLSGNPCKINCEADSNKTIEVSANGIVHPCCWFSGKLRSVYSNFYIDNETDTPTPNLQNLEVSKNYSLFVNDIVPIIESQGGIKTLSLKYTKFDDIMKTPLFSNAIENLWGKYSVCNVTCSVINETPIYESYSSSVPE
jgi:molybdenum cofactor biosynthesis enzyme MoaA